MEMDHKMMDHEHQHGGGATGGMMMDHGDLKKRFFGSLILTIPILLLSSMTEMLFGIEIRFTGSDILLFVLATILFFYGGWPFLKGMIGELKGKSPAMMTLISLAVITSYLYSTVVLFTTNGMNYFFELATLIDIMLLGHWIEMNAIMKAGNALSKMAELLPKEAHLIEENGTVRDVALQGVGLRQRLLVKEGEKIPADGKIVKGATHINEAMLTGESKAVEKQSGDEVIAGSINGNSVIEIEVSRTGEDSYLSQIIKLVSDAEKQKSRTENLSDSAAKLLFYIALAAGIITFIVWFILSSNWAEAVNRAVTVLIIACPHALGLAIPLVVAKSTSLSAKNGLLVRKRNALEEARLVNTIAFDKTGTLTEGEFRVTNLEAENELDFLRVFASLEAQMSHPIATSIVALAEKRGIALQAAENVTALPGVGLKGDVDGKLYKVVNTRYLEGHLSEVEQIRARELSAAGKTVSFLLSGEKVLGFVAVADEIRKSAKETVSGLHAMAKKAMMLTGDTKGVAEKIGTLLGIDYVEAELLPEDKARVVKEFEERKEKIMMVGDGVNDSPALAASSVGVAIGAGTDVALETADVILSKNNPKDVLYLIRLSRATYKKMMQNLWWGAGYNVVAIPLAAGVLAPIGVILSPAIGAVLMSLSTVIVALNAMTLRVKE